MTKRIIRRKFYTKQTRTLSQIIATINAELPKSAPETVIQRASDNEAAFDIRYLTPMLRQYLSSKMSEIEAKELEPDTI